MIVTIVAIAENGCDDPDDHHMEPPIFVVTIVTIRIATIVEIELVLSRRSKRSSDDQVTIENLMETTSAAIITIETISCSLQCISFLDLHHLQNGVSQQPGATQWYPHKFYLRSPKV